MAADVWAFCRDDLTAFGLARLIDDYDDRALIIPDRTGGPERIARDDFAAGWIAHARRCGANVYLSESALARFGKR